MLLNRFKHDGRLECGRLLAGILAKHLIAQQQDDNLQWPEALIPVPLHWRRLQRRGFNQSLEIAGLLSRELDLPICLALQRTRATQSQQELDRATRQHNLAGAFTLSRAVPYRHVALVDDVLTTGSTANAISRLLLTHGVQSVQVWGVARTPVATTPVPATQP